MSNKSYPQIDRASAITVGTSFNGITEVMMRGPTFSLWCPMQPVEIIELIHQLAANVGCHIHIQPRRDFSSWRDWKYTEEELAHYRGNQSSKAVGFAPHPNDMAPYVDKGAVLPPPEQQPGLHIERKEHEAVAIEKPNKRRSTKRAAASA